MVKNTTGGSKHKNVARKSIGGGRGRLRTAEEGEIYAVVTKILGGPNCSVVGCDDKERMCVIRGKFRAPGRKRDNSLRTGTLVLVGDRDWESSTTRLTCDLLEVYSDSDRDKLKNKETAIDWNFLNTATDRSVKPTSGASGEKDCDRTDGIEFTDDTVEEEYKALIEAEAGDGENVVLDFKHTEEVNIDDI